MKPQPFTIRESLAHALGIDPSELKLEIDAIRLRSGEHTYTMDAENVRECLAAWGDGFLDELKDLAHG